MTKVKELTEAAQDQVLAAIKIGQAVMVEGVTTISDAVERVTPDSIKAKAIPGIEHLPKPKELVDISFDFAQALLNNQKEFAANLLAAAGSKCSVSNQAASKAA